MSSAIGSQMSQRIGDRGPGCDRIVRPGHQPLAPVAPQAPEEGMSAYPVPPEGFNVARDAIAHGELTAVEYESKTLGIRRLLRVYTPPGYSVNRKYPVLYLQHGLGNTSTEWTQRARAPIIADNLLADGKMHPMIIVFPSGNATATPADEKQDIIRKEPPERRASLAPDARPITADRPGRGAASAPCVLTCPNRSLCKPIALSVSRDAATNLVDNAIKYRPQGSPIEITIGAGTTDAALTADQGHGVPAKHRARVFDRFYRVDEGRSRVKGGTGCSG